MSKVSHIRRNNQPNQPFSGNIHEKVTGKNLLMSTEEMREILDRRTGHNGGPLKVMFMCAKGMDCSPAMAEKFRDELHQSGLEDFFEIGVGGWDYPAQAISRRMEGYDLVIPLIILPYDKDAPPHLDDALDMMDASARPKVMPSKFSMDSSGRSLKDQLLSMEYGPLLQDIVRALI